MDGCLRKDLAGRIFDGANDYAERGGKDMQEYLVRKAGIIGALRRR